MKAFCILIIALIQISGLSIVQARNLSNSSRDANSESQAQDAVRLWQLSIPCNGGYQPDGQGGCRRADGYVDKQPSSKPIQQDQTKKSNNDKVSEAALIAKNKEEIMRRCGLEESKTTKIVGMKEEDRRSFYIGDRSVDKSGVFWVITYRTDTGNVIFGERQFEKSVCSINKKTGEAELKVE
jgi:type II secretory pathway pseudopilin PulG